MKPAVRAASVACWRPRRLSELQHALRDQSEEGRSGALKAPAQVFEASAADAGLPGKAGKPGPVVALPTEPNGTGCQSEAADAVHDACRIQESVRVGSAHVDAVRGGSDARP